MMNTPAFVLVLLLAAAPFLLADSGGRIIREQAAYDVLYYRLDLRINPATKSIRGSLLARAAVVDTLSRFVLDLNANFTVDSVRLGDTGATFATYEFTGGRIWIDLPSQLSRPRPAPSPTRTPSPGTWWPPSSLAVRGYLRVEQVSTAFDKKDYAFRRLKRVMGDPDIRPFELFVLAKLFGRDWNVNMRLLSEVRRDYDNVFPPICDEIYRTIVKDGMFAASPERVRSAWAAGGLGLAAAGVAAFVVAPPWLPTSPAIVAVGLVVSGLVLLVFSRAMPRQTWKGARSLLHVRGFQEFLERAEKDRLARLPSPALAS